ncbi:MAG: hypothetical protein K2I42_01890 [Anaeroplasmataceae bacterium]|nr:hypothetical protein [Anaeroplasmataceae bacterium]
MKKFLKKYLLIIIIAIVINLPIIVIGAWRTDKTVTLKGDTTLVEDFVEIEGAHQQKGTLSTIYVISMDHSTILQNLMVKLSKTSELSDLPESYLHLTDSELSLMGRIQHSSSITYALIHSYNEAHIVDPSITISYQLVSFKIEFYRAGSEFRIGDDIIGINDYTIKENLNQFIEAFNAAKEGDIYQVKRGNEILNIAYSSLNRPYGYAIYDIDSSKTSPKFTIKATNVGGPSGGLLQTLALYNALIEEDITKGLKIAGTGTIEPDGTVGPIGGIQQKIYTAFDDKMDVFLCPAENYEEALIAYNKLPNKKMKLIRVATFKEALEELKNA